MNELGIDCNTLDCIGNITYKPILDDCNIIIQEHMFLFILILILHSSYTYSLHILYVQILFPFIK